MLAGLEREFADRPVVVISVHSPKFPNEGDVDAVRDAVRRYDVTHPVVVDTGHDVWMQYGVRAWPTLFVVDPEGFVVAGGSGEPDPASLSRIVGDLLERHRSSLAETALPLAVEPGVGGLLRYPSKVSVRDGSVAITDTGHHRVLLARLSGDTLRVEGAFGGPEHGFVDGPPSTARFAHPYGTAFVGDRLYVADAGNHAIRAVDLTTGETTTVAGTGRKGGYPPAAGRGPSTSLRSPWDVAWDGRRLLVAMAGSHQIWSYDPDTELAEPFAGSGREARIDGSADEAAFAQPSGLAVSGGVLYVADSEISSIRAVDLGTRETRTVCGGDLFEFGDVDGTGDEVRLQHVMGIAAGSGGLWIADSYNHKIKLVDPPSGACRTAHGSGVAGAGVGDSSGDVLAEPEGLAALPGGDLLVADTNNHRVVRLSAGRLVPLLS